MVTLVSLEHGISQRPNQQEQIEKSFSQVERVTVLFMAEALKNRSLKLAALP
jgi:hypothetical protein